MNLQRFSLGPVDSQKILKGFLIAMGGAALTYVATLISTGSIVKLGLTPVEVGLLSVVVNALIKVLDGVSV